MDPQRAPNLITEQSCLAADEIPYLAPAPIPKQENSWKTKFAELGQQSLAVKRNLPFTDVECLPAKTQPFTFIQPRSKSSSIKVPALAIQEQDPRVTDKIVGDPNTVHAIYSYVTSRWVYYFSKV